MKNQKGMLYAALAAAAYFLLKKGSNAGSSPDTSNGLYETDLLSSLLSGVTSAVGELTGTLQENFVTVMTPIAEQVHAAYDISPLVTITQAAHESGWGASGLTKKANNLYGYTGDAALNSWLKAKGLPATTNMQDILNMDLSAAPFIIMKTHEEVDGPMKYFSRPGDVVSVDGSDAMIYRPFRRYDSWASSVEDWVQLLRNPRYAAALSDAKAGDMEAFANDIYAAGYATESDYPRLLVAVADKVSDIQNA